VKLTDKNYIKYILVILVISSISFTWFKGKYFIWGGDYLPIFHPIGEFIQDTFIWLSSDPSGLGGDTRALPEIFPYELLTAFGYLLGFSVINLQKMLFYVMMSISGLSMFLLVCLSFQRLKNRNLAAFLSALFYMLNSYTMFFKWPDRCQSLFSYMFLPLALGLYIKGLEKRNNLLYSIGIAFVFLFMAPAATTPTYLLIVIIVLFLYYLFYNIFSLRFTKLKKSTLFSIKAIILMTLFNVWWILPYFYNIIYVRTGVELFQIAKTVESFQNTFGINSVNTSFLNIFRLIGYWALDAKDGGYYYYPLLSKVYTSPFFIYISIFIPIIVFSSCLIKQVDQRIRKLVLFFLFLSIGSLFFVKGVHEPFGDINKWLFYNIPFFSMFRSQYEKIGVVLVLGYSVLFGFMISYIYSYFNDKTRVILAKSFVIIIFVVFFIIHMFPLWTGYNIQEKRGHLKSQRVKVPTYYRDAYLWFKKNSNDQRLLIFPLSSNRWGNIDFQWGGANGNILAKLLDQPVITRISFGDLGDNLNLIIKISPIFNTGWIITDSSRVRLSYNYKAFQEVDQFVIDGNIQVIKEFRGLKIVKISDDYFLPHIYASPKGD